MEDLRALLHDIRTAPLGFRIWVGLVVLTGLLLVALVILP